MLIACLWFATGCVGNAPKLPPVASAQNPRVTLYDNFTCGEIAAKHMANKEELNAMHAENKRRHKTNRAVGYIGGLAVLAVIDGNTTSDMNDKMNALTLDNDELITAHIQKRCDAQ